MTVIIAQKKSPTVETYDVPAGGEILWYGAGGDVPTNWTIDTATYDEFIRGADEGGSSDVEAGAGSHNHSPQANTSTAANHTHGYSGTAGSSGSPTEVLATATESRANNSHNHSYSGTSGSGGTHSHGLGSITAATIFPPYKRLYWISADVDVEAPIGGIIMWDGDYADRPSGFVLCDGAEVSGGLLQTPDLTDKFVYGASADGEVNDEGGAQSHQHTNSSVGSDGAHTHSISGTTGGPNGTTKDASTFTGVEVASKSHTHSYSATTDSQAAHTHTLADTDAEDNLPPYCKLYYLMRQV